MPHLRFNCSCNTNLGRVKQIKTAFIWDDALTSYRFSPEHPLNPRRLELALALIRAMHLLDGDDVAIVAPRTATDAELRTVHTANYIDAVKLARPNFDYGLGTDDVPAVQGMHAAAAHVVGATLTAAELVMSGRATRAFNMSGGLHHAHPARASGFCVYNDLAVAIRWLQQAHGARVMYIDYDAHHGDGVQAVFYEDPDVLTVSYHESGAFLFPGTGFIDEIGEGDGYGFSANVPLEPHTGDASLGNVFNQLVPELAAAFKPDVIVLQNGCDAHVLDPLTHLRCTTGIFERLVRTVCAIADEHCGGRIIATGGGGYAVEDVVPRAWTLVWSALCGVTASNEIPRAWIDAVERQAGRAVPHELRDGILEDEPHGDAESGDIDMNDKTMRAVRNRVLPLLTGWGLAF
ncbi:MAG TPA: acetoin utilization protein AcuC [Longimicrobiales bacterium]